MHTLVSAHAYTGTLKPSSAICKTWIWSLGLAPIDANHKAMLIAAKAHTAHFEEQTHYPGRDPPSH